MCDTLDDWLRTLGLLMFDPSHVTWSKETKTAAINQAISAVTAVRPDGFSTVIEVKLKPGEEQSLPNGVTNIVGDIRQVCVDKSGTTVTLPPVKKGDESESTAFKFFAGKGCVAEPDKFTEGSECDRWQIASWTYDTNTPTRLLVDPPVPSGITPTIKVAVHGCPKCYVYPADATTELPCGFKTEITEYALYMLYSIDAESEFYAAKSQRHFSNFATMMDRSYRAVSRVGSGYSKGKVGSGDPQVVR
jgi:hypothetical protein